jgi:hypothetical protein
MKKLKDFLVALIILAIIVAAFWLIRPDWLFGDNNDEGANLEVEQAVLAENYEVEVQKIISEYNNLVANNNLSSSSADGLKERLMNLRVPSEYRDGHINLVLSLDSMKSYLSDQEIGDKIKGLDFLNKAKEKLNLQF